MAVGPCRNTLPVKAQIEFNCWRVLWEGGGEVGEGSPRRRLPPPDPPRQYAGLGGGELGFQAGAALLGDVLGLLAGHPSHLPKPAQIPLQHRRTLRYGPIEGGVGERRLGGLS